MEVNELFSFRGVIGGDGVYSLGVTYKNQSGLKDLYFKISGTSNELDTQDSRSEAFILAVLIPSMREGADLLVGALVDDRFLFNINNQVIPFLCTRYKDLKRIKVTSASQVDETRSHAQPSRRRKTFLGMSCGLDSLAAFHTHESLSDGSGLKVNGFIFNNVGAFNGYIEKFNQDLQNVMEFAREVNLPLFVVDSNIDDLYTDKFVQSFSLRNAAAAWAVSAACDTVIYASGFQYSAMESLNQSDIGLFDPIMFPLVSARNFSVLHSGFQFGRTEKYDILLRENRYIRFLNVCTRPVHKKRGFINCGLCKKCSEILFRAEACDRLSDLASTFDLEMFRSRRNYLLYRLINNSSKKNPSPNSIDTINSLLRNNFSRPVAVNFAAKIAALLSRLG